jgi:broad specificity phosphatase PhoE
MNLHTLPRTFFLTRHGQSEYNLLGKIGGDSGLTPAGVEYARRLAQFAKEHIAVDEGSLKERPCRLWTSTLLRTKETTQFIDHHKFEHGWDNGDTGEWLQFRRMPRRNLDELYAGTCDGMTYKEIEQCFPDEFARRQEDKLAYRYPRGTLRNVTNVGCTIRYMRMTINYRIVFYSITNECFLFYYYLLAYLLTHPILLLLLYQVNPIWT